MRDLLTHRGPDGCGIFIDRRIGLGHRRLSIVDIAAGQQPMANEDETVHIVFNGEIYNHAEFREPLQSSGHHFRSHCDTETILHLYEEYGERVVEHLRGMFAFAIWDQNRRELFIARDRLGVKPLYYVHAEDGSLYFASEIKALLTVRGVRAELNYSALPDYLANHAPSGEQTLFRHVKRLLPGHTLHWRNGEVRIEQYWDVHFAQEPANACSSDGDYIARWTELFQAAVRLRLMADVPLGMFLSGGIDSSAIAAVMSGMVQEPIKTFSVAFAEREANELEYARIVARAFKTDHHEFIVTPERFFAALPDLVWHEDEPLAHPSSVALFFVSQLASQYVKVVLTGEGSDESLAGYDRYRKTVANIGIGTRYHRLTPRVLRNLVHNGIDHIPSLTARQKLRRTFLYLPPEIDSIYFDNFAVFSRRTQQDLLTPDTKMRVGDPDPYATVRTCMAHTDAGTLLQRLLYADTKTYLQELLMKQDQMSMAASIESRVPFLDHKLIEFTAQMPERMKLRGWTTKYVLRESMKGLLPETILKRGKMGFPVPIGSWFRGAYRKIVEEYVLGERAIARGIFDRTYTLNLVQRHDAGENHDERLWALVNFEIWMRRFIDDDVSSPSWKPGLLAAPGTVAYSR